MSNLNSIQKAIVEAQRKAAQVEKLKCLVSNVESRKSTQQLFKGEVRIYTGSGDCPVLLGGETLDTLFPSHVVVVNANAQIKKLEAELSDLNALLEAFDKVMEPILKEQEQC